MELKKLIFTTEQGNTATDSMRVALYTGRQHKNIRKSVMRLIKQGFKSCFYEIKDGTRLLFVMNRKGFELVTKTLPGIEELRDAALRAFDNNTIVPAHNEKETKVAISDTPKPEKALAVIKQRNGQFINARTLYAFLNVGRDFSTWFADKVNRYGFEKGVDFDVLTVIPQKGEKVGRPAIDYILTLDVAKELCMVEGNERGRIARKYFIEVEKKFRAMVASTTPAIPQTFAEALRLAASQAEQIEQQQKQIEAERPKVNFATAVETSNCSCLIGELAKMMCQNGVPTGEKRLFQWMRDNGYLCQFGERYNQPTQKAIEMGLFEVKKQTWTKPSGEVMTSTTTKVTGKGQIYFINKFLYKSQNNQQIYINE